jgi:hypothetical protein
MLGRYKKSLISLFRRVHELEADRVGNRLLALEIQEELLARITHAERRIRKARAANVQVKRSRTQRGNTRDASARLKAMHQRGFDYVSGQKSLIMALRTIGDAVAFIYGDRHELKQLARAEDAGFITGKQGTRLERAILRASFQWGATVVMNDLTNNLRHGDITIFRPDLWPDGDSPIMLFEVKSGRGGNRQRAERQQQAAKEIMSYIHTDQRETEEGRYLRIETKERSQHHFEAITRLVKNLPAKGWSAAEIEPGLHYLVISCEAPNDIISQAFESLKGTERQWLVMDVNNFKGSALGYYPFPLCILDAGCLFGFYNGEFVINVLVGMHHVNQVVAAKNIGIELTDDAWKIVSLESNDGWGERYVTPRAVGQLAAEFLSLRWFIDHILLGQMTETMSRLFQEQAARSQ